MARHNEIGKIGEEIATKWLVQNGLIILQRNYLKKWGEIDIVARETNKIHFVEVKSVSHETIEALNWNVSRGTYRPEENIHQNKKRRLARAIETWLMENKHTDNFQIDVVTVRMVPREKYAKVKFIENITLD